MANVKQAPNMWGIAPDIAAQQVDIQKRQQLVDMLRKENDKNTLDTQYVTGAGPTRAVPTSNFQVLAKLLQTGLGAYHQNKLNSESNDLSKRSAEAQNQQFEKMLGNSAPSTNDASVVSTYKAPDGTTIGDTGSQSVPVNAAPPLSDDDRLRNQARAAMLSGNTDLANDIIKNLSLKTNEMRNMDAMGQDRALMGKYATAEAKKKGMLEMQPNNTVLDLSTNQRMVAPDFKAGVAGGYSPNGMPTMSGIAGNEVIPQMAGETKRAEAAGAAGYDMVTVNTPNGPVMMTKENAAKLSGGGNQSSQDASGLDLSKLGPDQQAFLAKTNPQAFANGVADFQRTGMGNTQPQAQNQNGIKLQTDEQKAFEGTVAKGAGEDLLKGRDQAKGAADNLFGINESRKAIASGAFLGAGADLKTDAAKAIKSIVGIDIDPNKVSNSEYLRTTLGQGMLDNAKKLGINPTDADAKRLDAIIGTIAKDPKALSKALDFQEEMAIRAINKHNANIADAEKRGLSSPYNLSVELPRFESVQENSGGTVNTPKGAPVDYASRYGIKTK